MRVLAGWARVAYSTRMRLWPLRLFLLDSDTWPVGRNNVVSIELLARDPAVTPTLFLRDVELEVRYLMGRHFHCAFVDPDLGPYGERGDS